MSVRSGSRVAVLSAMVAVPAVVLISACGSSSTSPQATTQVDTVGVSANSFIIEQYDSDYYYTDDTQDDGDFVEIEGGDDYREIMQYPLPALHGQRVVDSASVFEYACYDYDDERTSPPPHGTAAARRLAARRAKAGYRIGARDLQPAILLDHLHFAGSYVEASAWGGDFMGASATLIGSNDVSIGWKEASVTANVQADYAAGYPNSQYRIRYASNPGSGEYYVDFGGLNDCDDNGAAGGSFLVVWAH
jgi:hypothetical protein